MNRKWPAGNLLAKGGERERKAETGSVGAVTAIRKGVNRKWSAGIPLAKGGERERKAATGSAVAVAAPQNGECLLVNNEP
ncbi:MAG: hypothetical protein LBP25_05720 [Tannerellaceae bacterium]|nr:hypothetical protein [Tannerellaceae bacterium]